MPAPIDPKNGKRTNLFPPPDCSPDHSAGPNASTNQPKQSKRVSYAQGKKQAKADHATPFKCSGDKA